MLGPQDDILHVVPTGRDFAGAAVFISGRNLFRASDRQVAAERCAPNAIAQKTIRRGAEILGLGLLFRLQEYVLAWGWSPWSDLLRVDILNTIGVSMMLMGGVCWIVLKLGPATRIRQVLGATAGGVALADFAANAAALDHVASAMVAVADRVVY